MSRLWVQAFISPHALWLWNRSFVPLKPYFGSRVACPFNKVSRTQVGMSEVWPELHTDTKYELIFLPVLLTSNTQRSFYLPHYVECLLRMLLLFTRPVIMLDCPILWDNYLALAVRLMPEISC